METILTRIAAGIYFAKVADDYISKTPENKYPKLYIEKLDIEDLVYLLEPLDKGYTDPEDRDDYYFGLEYLDEYKKPPNSKNEIHREILTIYTVNSDFSIKNNGNNNKIDYVEIEFIDIGSISKIAYDITNKPYDKLHYYINIKIHISHIEFNFTVDLNKINHNAFLDEFNEHYEDIFQILSDLYRDGHNIEFDAIGVRLKIPEEGDYIDRINALYNSGFKIGEEIFIDFRQNQIYYGTGTRLFT